MLRHYITIAFRNLLKYKVQTVISIIGLSVGLACFAFCSYQFRVNLDFDKDFRDADRIYIPYIKTDTRVKTDLPPEIRNRLKKEYPAIEASTDIINISPYTEKLCEVSGKNGQMNYFKESFLFTDSQFLDFFGLELLSGDKNEIANTPDALVITRKTALKLYGTENVIGKTFVNVNDFDNERENCIIRGVMQDFPPQTRFEQKSGIILNTTHPALIRMQDEVTSQYVKLRKGTDVTGFNRVLTQLPVKGIQEDKPETTYPVRLIHLQDFSSLFSKGDSMSIPVLFFIIGLLVLLTALFNYLLFIFGQMLNRSKECGIRKVNGGSTGSFFILFFTEACITFLITCLISFILIEQFIPVIESFSHTLILDKNYILRLMLQYALAGIGCIALLCWLVIKRLDRQSVIQNVYKSSLTHKKGITREVLICIQITISFLFLGSAWFVRQQSKLIESTLTAGLDETDLTCLYTISLNGEKLQAARPDILRKLRENPEIECISCNGMGVLGAWQLGKDYFTWDGITETEKNTTLGNLYVEANYPDIIKQKVIQGRFFSAGEIDKAVVNESFSRLIGKNPIGLKIGIRGWDRMNYYEITGVIPDIINNPNALSFKSDKLILPCFYLPYPEGHVNMECVVKVKPQYRKSFRKVITAELHKYVNQATDIYVHNMKEYASFYTDREHQLYKITSLFAIICILISLLGIHTAIRLNTEQRKKEVAIRKINGATHISLLFLLGKKNLIQLILSTCFSFPLLFIFVNRWVQNYPVQITIGIMPFFLLFFLMTVIITFTVIRQIIQIARTNPAEIIKNE